MSKLVYYMLLSEDGYKTVGKKNISIRIQEDELYMSGSVGGSIYSSAFVDAVRNLESGLRNSDEADAYFAGKSFLSVCQTLSMAAEPFISEEFVEFMSDSIAGRSVPVSQVLVLSIAELVGKFPALSSVFSCEAMTSAYGQILGREDFYPGFNALFSLLTKVEQFSKPNSIFKVIPQFLSSLSHYNFDFFTLKSALSLIAAIARRGLLSDATECEKCCWFILSYIDDSVKEESMIEDSLDSLQAFSSIFPSQMMKVTNSIGASPKLTKFLPYSAKIILHLLPFDNFCAFQAQALLKSIISSIRRDSENAEDLLSILSIIPLSASDSITVIDTLSLLVESSYCVKKSVFECFSYHICSLDRFFAQYALLNQHFIASFLSFAEEEPSEVLLKARSVIMSVTIDHI